MPPEAPLTPDEINTNDQELLSATDIFKTMSELSWSTALSYTFSFQMVLLTVLSRQLGQDKNHQDAAALITTLVNCIATVSMSPLFATSMKSGLLRGQLKHAENHANEVQSGEIESPEVLLEKISETFRSSLVLAQGVSSPIAILPLVFSKNILTTVFQQDPDVSTIVQQFTRYYAISMPGLMLRMCAEQQMFARGNNIPPMVMAQISFLVTMFAGTAFAEGWFGLHKYGEEALLTACIIEAYTTAVAFTLYIASHSEYRDFEFLNLVKPFNHFKDIFSSIVRLGASFPLPFLIEFGMNLSVTLIAAHKGLKAQSQMGLIMQYALPVQLLSSAFGQCTAQEMSRKLGEQDKKNAYRVGTFGLATSLVTIAPIAIFFAALPNLLEGKENFDDVSMTTRWVAVIMSAGFILDVVRFNLLQQLRVLGEPNSAALISCVALIMGLALSVILTTQTTLGVIGDAIGYTSGNLLANFILGSRWLPRISALNTPEEPASLNHTTIRFFSEARVRTEDLTQVLLDSDDMHDSQTIHPENDI